MELIRGTWNPWEVINRWAELKNEGNDAEADRLKNLVMSRGKKKPHLQLAEVIGNNQVSQLARVARV